MAVRFANPRHALFLAFAIAVVGCSSGGGGPNQGAAPTHDAVGAQTGSTRPTSSIGRKSESTVPAGEGDGGIDYANLLVDGVQQSTPAAAEGMVGYSITLPAGVKPSEIWARKGADATGSAVVFAVSDSLGRYVILEIPPTTDQSGMEARAGWSKSPGSEVSRSDIVTLPDGVRALSFDGANTNGVMLLRGGVEIRIYGNSSEFAASDAVKLASDSWTDVSSG